MLACLAAVYHTPSEANEKALDALITATKAAGALDWQDKVRAERSER